MRAVFRGVRSPLRPLRRGAGPARMEDRRRLG